MRKKCCAGRTRPRPLTADVDRAAVTRDDVPTFPPEWATQAAVLIAWPHRSGDFGPWLQRVEKTYCLFTREVARRETVLILALDADHVAHIMNRLTPYRADPDNVRFVTLPYNDVWVRDTAPITIITPRGASLVDFRFNGWGGKYSHQADAELSRRLYASGVFKSTALQPVDLILEGGSIESDGRGTLLTTRRCLLNPNRNPALTQDEIASRLAAVLGAERILWLSHGHVEGDDTDAHVDTLARFCPADTIAYVSCDDPDDPHFTELGAMEAELKAFKTPAGNHYRLVPLPLPRAIYGQDGRRLPATYANFLIINGAVLVPAYGDPADQTALERLSACFPGRELVSIPCTSLINQFGSLHCMSMQFPQPVRLTRK
jgi:agmatine/peptidylarginine deiminase